MIIDHTHPLYKQRIKEAGENKYNGAYYYSQEIVKYIIPNVKTDMNWITVNIPALKNTNLNLDHSIVFIHNNIQPNAYSWLNKYNDLILVCGVPSTMENMRFFGEPVYLPLSVSVNNVLKYKHKTKTRNRAFAGRRNKLNNRVPKDCDILTGIPRWQLLQKMARYRTVYAVGRTAIEAKILGAEIGVYDERFPDPEFWGVVDSKEAAQMLQNIIDVKG